MSISFNEIPSDIRVPLTYVEFDNTRAVTGTPAMERKLLAIGQKLPAGAHPARDPLRITSADQAAQAFGRGSMLAAMFKALKKADSYSETWAVALEDDEAGQAATATLAVTTAPSEGGTVNLYIGGNRIRAKAVAGESAGALAGRIASAVNAEADLPVTAAAAGSIVTLACKWAGETGNDIDIRLNLYREQSPRGLALAITPMSGGTANPDITPALAAMGDEWWNSIVFPYADLSNRRALEEDLLLRWGPLKQMEGIAYAAYRGSHGQTGAYGAAGNGHLVSCMGTGESPTPPYIWAVVNAVIAHKSLGTDPARPLQTLGLPGVLPPAIKDRWTMEERNLLLHDGISTAMVQAGDTTAIERQITMYQKNAYGLADPSYLDVNTPATLGYIRYAVRSRISQRFPRHKLANDGTRFGPGQAVVTPSIIRGELIALFRELEEKGLVEDAAGFKQGLIVERNADDRNRVDVLMTPDLVNQFRIFAACVQFIL